jgi:hypothetical protein
MMICTSKSILNDGSAYGLGVFRRSCQPRNQALVATAAMRPIDPGGSRYTIHSGNKHNEAKMADNREIGDNDAGVIIKSDGSFRLFFGRKFDEKQITKLLALEAALTEPVLMDLLRDVASDPQRELLH